MTASDEKYGPWNPGLSSTMPRDVLRKSTLFDPRNVETSFEEAHELSDFCGFKPFELVRFKTERLLLHQVLVMVTADLSVPDGPDYEELGLNLREMTQNIFDQGVQPDLAEFKTRHQELNDTAQTVMRERLKAIRTASIPTPVNAVENRSFFKRLFNRGDKSAPSAASTKPQSPIAMLENDLLEAETDFDAGCIRSLKDCIEGVLRTRGSLPPDDDLILSVATTIFSNGFAAHALANDLTLLFDTAVKNLGYRKLPPQDKPVILNVKGASASGKSTIRPQQRQLAERMSIPWEDFALISPDYWRKHLLDYDSLGSISKYAGMLTGHELAIIDGKLDAYMAQKAQSGPIPHLLIDRFRFDSFKTNEELEDDSRLLTRFGDTVHMFFMITPPEATVERAWLRGLTTGRFKAIDDLLDHNVEAYTGMPDLFFSWALSNKKVHYEFLDNSVTINEQPKTVAYGWNDQMVILDPSCLSNVDRFKKINIDAESAADVYLSDEDTDTKHDFLKECAARFSKISFAEQKTGHVYGVMEKGDWRYVDHAHLKTKKFPPADKEVLLNLGWAEASDSQKQPPNSLNSDEQMTLGQWGK